MSCLTPCSTAHADERVRPSRSARGLSLAAALAASLLACGPSGGGGDDGDGDGDGPDAGAPSVKLAPLRIRRLLDRQYVNSVRRSARRGGGPGRAAAREPRLARLRVDWRRRGRAAGGGRPALRGVGSRHLGPGGARPRPAVALHGLRAGRPGRRRLHDRVRAALRPPRAAPAARRGGAGPLRRARHRQRGRLRQLLHRRVLRHLGHAAVAELPLPDRDRRAGSGRPVAAAPDRPRGRDPAVLLPARHHAVGRAARPGRERGADRRRRACAPPPGRCWSRTRPAAPWPATTRSASACASWPACPRTRSSIPTSTPSWPGPCARRRSSCCRTSCGRRTATTASCSPRATRSSTPTWPRCTASSRPRIRPRSSGASLPADGGRMGILGQAGFLALHAHPGLTSPTRRGRFIVERLLCREVPPPPPDVNPILPGGPGPARDHAREAEPPHGGRGVRQLPQADGSDRLRPGALRRGRRLPARRPRPGRST